MADSRWQRVGRSAIGHLPSAIVVCALLARPLGAQIDPRGSWRTLDTPHFSVHARAEHRDLAQRAAGEAELAYAALARVLPAPRRRIDLIVADNVDQSNGYATTYPGNTVVVYAVPPAGDLELVPYDRWLRLVITHELAHIFHLDLAGGWWGVGRKLLGRAPFLFPNQYTPPWQREGLAVFYESRLTGAGRLAGAFHPAVVGAEAAEAGAFSLGEADITSPKWPSGNRPYAFGAQFLAAAARDTAGDSVVARYARRTSRPLLPWLSLSGDWKDETGNSLGEAWDAWQDSLARAEAARPPAVAGDIRALRLAAAPRLSANGRTLLVAHNDGRDATRLLTIDLGSGVQRRVGWLPGLGGVAWQPDGQVLVAAYDFTDRYTTRSDLWQVDPNNGTARQLTHGARLVDPDVAPDGARVAVRLVPGGNELVIIDSSGAAGVIAAGGPGLEWATPRFSPDGRLIAAVRVRRGWHDIVVRGRAGGPWIEITRDSVPDRQPVFTPDQHWLMWSRELDGVPQIVAVVANDSGGMPSARFTDEPFGAWAPAPAGDSLYYLSYHADGFRLASRAFQPVPWSLPVLTAPVQPTAPDSAPISGEHDYQPLRSLWPRYWVPQLYLQSGGGHWLGAFTSGNDALERHAYAVSVMLGSGALAGQWQGTFAYLFAGPGQALLDASWTHQPYLVDTSSTSAPAPAYCCAPDDEAHLGVSFVRRRTRSQWQLRTGVEYTRGGYERVGASVTAGFSTPVSAPLGISTQGGWRIAGSMRFRRRMFEDRHSGEYVMRAAGYQALGGRQFAQQVLALRLAVATTSGNDRPDYSVGGVSSGAFDLLAGVSLGGASRTFQVRGYPPGYLSGPTAVGGTLEYRLPLSLVAKNLGLAPVGLDRLSAAAFFDAGQTASPQYCPVGAAPPPGPTAPAAAMSCDRTITSLGAELISDLVMGYSFPVRLRAGAALRMSLDPGVGAYVAFGSAF